MEFVTIRGIFISFIIAVNVLITTSASAALITYDYSFDTPVFTLPELANLNTILSAAGSTVTGSVSYNTEDTDPTGATELSRSYAPIPGTGKFTHTGELDSLFAFKPTTFWIDFGAPGTITEWRQNHPYGGNTFFVDFHTGAVHGECVYTGHSNPQINASPCSDNGAIDEFTQRINMQNLSLRQVEAVPVPATLALFGLGLAGLGWSTRKKA